MTEKGKFILFEGIDRCGKTTQSKRLVEKLNKDGSKAIWIRFPDNDTEIGKLLRQYLENAKDIDPHAVHLLFSANRWECQKKISLLLQQYDYVICDRYYYSGIAYTAAKGIDFDWCQYPDKGLIEPDIVFYLNLSIDEAEKRGGYGQERYEKREFQEKVKMIYENNLKTINWIVVDANNSQDQVFESIGLHVMKMFLYSACLDGLEEDIEQINEKWTSKGIDMEFNKKINPPSITISVMAQNSNK